MRKALLGTALLCGLIVLALAGTTMANSAVDSDEPAMMVSPSMIVLAKVDSITVHTNIPAGSVDLGTVDMDGVAPTGFGVDNCGDLVVGFATADLGLVPGEETLTMSGSFKTGGGFSVSDVVGVK